MTDQQTQVADLAQRIADALGRGDTVAAEAALDRLLELEPRDVWALVLKGDCRAALSDSRAATAFYQAALRTTDGMAEVPADVAGVLKQVEHKIAALSHRFEDDLRSRIEGFGPVSARIDEALDLLTGRRQVYHQQPQSFYYPGLPQIQFYERERFDWIAGIEAQTNAIREELLAVMAGEDAFRSYVESEPGRPAKLNPMVGDPRWGAYYLWQNGVPVPGQADRCPVTMAALESAPVPRIAGRSPMALFSRLRPGMHILPHTGFLNTRLICHLPLIVPPGCRFRVGNEVREWKEGRMLVFDDSIEHEAWNEGTGTRVVLLFEVWRPEIPEEDRAALGAMFEYIAAYGQ